MPKLAHLSGREIIRALERLGFEIVRQKRSHVVMRSGSRGCVVPFTNPSRWAPCPACCGRLKLKWGSSWIVFEPSLIQTTAIKQGAIAAQMHDAPPGKR